MKGSEKDGGVAPADVETAVADQQPSCLQKVSNAIVGTISKFFYKFGKLIARYPWAVILIDILVVLIFIPGIPFFFYEETAQENLWVPMNSEAQDDKKWVDTNFPSTTRFANVIAVADDVLTPTALQALMDIHMDVVAISEPNLHDWDSICYRFGSECWTTSLLEFWSYDETTIRALTRTEILAKVNSITTSPVYFNAIDIDNYLGQMTKDGSGQITGAKAATMNFVLKTNSTLTDNEDEAAQDWEKKFIDLLVKEHADLSEVFHFTIRSFGDEGGGRISDDIPLLGAGYLLIIVFVGVVLGRFNAVHQRIYVTLGGILCVGMAIGVSIGLCSYAGIPYGPLHNILPFLIIGIGVDDMFVIVQSWENIQDETEGQDLDLSERIGRMLGHAGVSITVTSITDVLAFAVGASTVLPALQSFCIYCAIGILFTYIFQATFFVACVTLDERRASSDRNACCCCYVHKDYEPNACSQKQYSKVFMEKYYGPFLMKLPVKIVAFILSLGLLGVCIWGVVSLEQEFDPIWFLPPDGNAYKYNEASKEYFPENSIVTVNVYMGAIDYYADKDKLLAVHTDMLDNEWIDDSTMSNWHYSFIEWMKTTADATVLAKLDADKYPTSEANFYDVLQTFTSGQGIRFIRDIQYTDSSNTAIRAARIAVSYIALDNSRERVTAMDSTREVIANSGYDHSKMFAYSRNFLEFESDKAIQNELYRNIGLAFLCIVLMTLLLIAHPWTCALVCVTVLVALVDIGGTIFFWGLTIDTVTTINLIVAIGLTVDYSAHIGHTFMTMTGTKNERVIKTLGAIGAAVFYGGFSTFLAFILLAGSKSYVFTTFFKVFLTVVIYGLYHGLVFLPVLLSWVGPAPYYFSSTDKPFYENNDKKDEPAIEAGVVANGDLPPKQNGSNNGHVNQGASLQDDAQKETAAL